MNTTKANHLKIDGSLLILVLEREAKPNRFNANENVVTEEYVYKNDRVRNIQNPFSRIIMAIKRYLENDCIKEYATHRILENKGEKMPVVSSNDLRQYLTKEECSGKMIKTLVNIINSATKLQPICHEINKAFGNDSKRGSAIYQIIRPLLKPLFQNHS